MTFIKHSVLRGVAILCVVVCVMGNPVFVQDFTGTRFQAKPVYNRALHAWTLEDAFVASSSNTVLFAQVCPVIDDCSGAMPVVARVVSGCAELRSLIDAVGWTNAHNSHDVCVHNQTNQTSAIHVDRQVRMVFSNAPGALQVFDTGVDEKAVTLRLRLLYVTTVAHGHLDIRIRMLTFALPIFADSHALVSILDMCSAQDLVAPNPTLSTEVGGSYITSRPIFDEHVCEWQCGHPYVKVPFNALAYLRGAPSTGQCVHSPAQFLILTATFQLVSIPPVTRNKSSILDLMARLDKTANATQARMNREIPGVVVLFAMRDSPGPSLSFADVIDPYALTHGASFRTLHNEHFMQGGLRRALTGAHSNTEVRVDVLVFSPLVDGSVPELVTALRTAIDSVNYTDIFEAEAYAVDVDMDTAHEFRRLGAPRPPPSSPATPVGPLQAAVTTSDPGTVAVAILLWFAAVLSCACCGFLALNMFCPQMHCMRDFFSFKTRHSSRENATRQWK